MSALTITDDEAAERLVKAATLCGDGYARVAFSVSGDLWATQQQFAVDINDSQRRRVRTQIREELGKFCGPVALQQLRNLAVQAFDKRLTALSCERQAIAPKQLPKGGGS